MISEGFVKLFLSLFIPTVGAVGYVHGTFATIEKVEAVETKAASVQKAVLRTDKLICKMAIRQKLERAEEICTKDLKE